MSYGLNVEMHKQTEICKRLDAIIRQVLPFLSGEVKNPHNQIMTNLAFVYVQGLSNNEPFLISSENRRIVCFVRTGKVEKAFLIRATNFPSAL